jgi:hypothetical protein
MLVSSRERAQRYRHHLRGPETPVLHLTSKIPSDWTLPWPYCLFSQTTIFPLCQTFQAISFSSHELSLPSPTRCWNTPHTCSAFLSPFFFFFWTGVSLCCLSWSQTPGLKQSLSLSLQSNWEVRASLFQLCSVCLTASFRLSSGCLLSWALSDLPLKGAHPLWQFSGLFFTTFTII